jgi:ATP-dependent phosphofructokinase / diphosphate-dependent phosphofructokinase
MQDLRNRSFRRISISTGGGDAPGLNAVIRAVVLSALTRGWEIYGIRDGYNGLLFPERYLKGGLIRLDRDGVRGITHVGGTILGTTNRDNPLNYPLADPHGNIERVDLSDDLVRSFRKHQIDATIAIGGDGSMEIAHVLHQKGVNIVGVPKTIDNDLDKTVITFGFDTAVAFATECLDRLHSTAASHRRVIVVEVMGRYAGWIALNAGIAGSADVILIPEIPFDIGKVVDKIIQREEMGREFTIVVVAEGALPVDGSRMYRDDDPTSKRLGGIGESVAAAIQSKTGKETRAVVLGHLLRGGSPTAFDRLTALRFGAAAVRAIDEDRFGMMVALDPPTVKYVPLEEATRRMKTVPLDCDTILTGRDLGISFGD